MSKSLTAAHIDGLIAASRDYVETSSSLLLSTAAARERYPSRPKAMDFFAGAGGMSLGMITASVEVVAAAEYDVYAAMTYAMNLCRWGELTIHYVTPEDEIRFNHILSGEYRTQGLEVEDGKVVRGKNRDLHKGNFARAGSGWIAGQPRSTPGVKHVFIGDVRKLSSQRILDAVGLKACELDIVSGGPPCQGYSHAGKRQVADPRNNLVFEFARFIAARRSGWKLSGNQDETGHRCCSVGRA